MKKFVDNHHGQEYEFEIVENWPAGDYQVWNVGRKNFQHRGFLPLVQTDGYFHVVLNTMKALRIGDEKLCLKIMKYAGYHTINEAKFNRLREIV